MTRTWSVVLGVVLSAVVVGSAVAEPQWQSLFDGKTLNGWIQRNGKAKYTVEDGMIVGTTVLNTPNSFLCTEKEYSDFILELEFLVDPTMNSGIQIRSHSYPDYHNGRVHGYQVEIDPSPRAWSGGIYDEARRGWLYPLKDKPAAQKAFKQGQWNHYRIEAIGDRIRTWVNGVPAADLVDDMTGRGFIALQVHSSKTAGQKIKWRNLRILDLSGANRPKLKALIIDGQNNHDWKATTPVIRDILEASSVFVQVDVATTPPKAQPMDRFRPDFGKYDVIVSNYNGDAWPEATRKAFVKYMKDGGGLVVIHAADNAFADWPEWNEMIALGGWGGRDERSGPFVYWKDGKLVRDNSPGRGGMHGQQTEWQVVHRNRDHAITAGLPVRWMHVKDELYSQLRGPAKNMTLLATARQDKSLGGTGRDEPVMFTVRYGKGRVFHTVMGHGPEQMHCVGFAVTLQRGAEWAATGRVTQLEVPADFPTAERSSMRSRFSVDFDGLRTYEVGQNRAAPAAVEAYVRSLRPEQYPAVEAKLLAVLKDPRTTYAGRDFVCRMLRQVGSAACVEALEPMLRDPKLSHMARYALQGNAAPEAAAAMRRALIVAPDAQKIGLVDSLGQRADAEAVGVIAPLVRSANADLAAAAINALGRIGTARAAEALKTARVAAGLEPARRASLLLCADRMVAAGQARQAMQLYRRLVTGPETPIRIAAYRGLVTADPAGSVPLLMQLLRDENADLRKAAGQFIVEVPGRQITQGVARELGRLDAAGQVVVISALQTRGDKTAASAVAKLVDRGDSDVRLAAIRALAVLGDASEVRLLAQVAAGNDAAAKAAAESLTRLSGAGVSEALIGCIRGRDAGGIRAAAIEAVVDRRDEAALPALVSAVRDTDATVRRAAARGLGELARPEMLETLVRLLVQAQSSADRRALEQSIERVIGRAGSVEPDGVIAVMDGAEADVQASLMGILARIGGPKSLAAVRARLGSSDTSVKRAAIQALAEWPDPAPLGDLLRLAQTEADTTNRILALRGYVQLLQVPANRSAAETTAALAKAMQIAPRAQEKRIVLSALTKFPCREALALAQSAQRDASLAAEAKLAVSKIQESLSKMSRKATASRNAGKAQAALDGKASTRWDTGRPMKPGDWFVLDMGMEAEVTGLTLDTRNSSNDFPRGYEVYVSFDGGNWGRPVVTGKGEGPVTKIRFPRPVRGRFIKIVQTGSHNQWFWSIHELTVDMK